MAESVHATAVLIGGDGVLIRGGPGAGKSTLALALIERGAWLIADDRLTLAACHDRLLATAPNATAGKIELRGRGILDLAHERTGVIRLVADIVSGDDLDRMPEATQLSTVLLGIVLPRQPIPTDTGRAVRLVEAALAGRSRQSDMGLRSVGV